MAKDPLVYYRSNIWEKNEVVWLSYMNAVSYFVILEKVCI